MYRKSKYEVIPKKFWEEQGLAPSSLSHRICRSWEYLILLLNQFTEAVTRKISVKKVLLKISQNSQEKICPRVFF